MVVRLLHVHCSRQQAHGKPLGKGIIVYLQLSGLKGDSNSQSHFAATVSVTNNNSGVGSVAAGAAMAAPLFKKWLSASCSLPVTSVVSCK